MLLMFGIQFAAPVATTVAVLFELHDIPAIAGSAVIFWQYLIATISIAIVASATLWLF
jgi:hypothetical protein